MSKWKVEIREWPDGFEGEMFEGASYHGYVFGDSEAEVLAKAIERKTSIIDARSIRANPKVVKL